MKADEYATRIISLCKEELLTVMPYMDRVLLNMPVILHDPENDPEAQIGFGTDGQEIHAFPQIIIETFMNAPEKMNRLFFHTLLHCLFFHMEPDQNHDEKMWNLSTDIMTESMILDLNLHVLKVTGDDHRRDVLHTLFNEYTFSSAQGIYRFFQSHPDVYQQTLEYTRLFQQDNHDLWYAPAKADIRIRQNDQNAWKEKRKQAEESARSYENARGLTPGTITSKLHLQAKNNDWSNLLQRFLQNEEVSHSDPDSFDYVMYTWGFMHYQNIPIIEPLESREDERIHEFVIAIDTSASCRKKKIRSFLEKTCSILAHPYFGNHLNVHIIQCDAKIQKETVITSEQQLHQYMQNLTVHGSGGTDYRPVFEKIGEELRDGTFSHLNGLIYFTDGNGTYPSDPPSFRTVFLIDPPSTGDIPSVPRWAVKILMNGDNL